MTRGKKILLVIVLACAAGAYAISQFSLHAELEKRITAALVGQGLKDVTVAVDAVDNNHISFSHIAFTKGKTPVAMDGLVLVATTLPYSEIVRGDVSHVAGTWQVKTLTIPNLPALAGEGKIENQTISGALASADKSASGNFTANAQEAVLEHVKLLWQQAEIRADKIRIAIAKPAPVRLLLNVRNLPLEVLLDMVPDKKATGTGMVSGVLDVTITPEGKFSVGASKFTTGKGGLFKLAPEVLPGDQPQVQMAREALSDFHYSDLTLALSPDKQKEVIMHLVIEGNNPSVFNGRAVKLQVNFSGDVLELFQQTLLPMADPAEFITQEHP